MSRGYGEHNQRPSNRPYHENWPMVYRRCHKASIWNNRRLRYWFDKRMTELAWINQIIKYIFSKGRPFHFDLVSINIQRARDHGIPGYNTFRTFCNLTAIKTWDDMKLAIPEDVVDIFSKLYRSCFWRIKLLKFCVCIGFILTCFI